MNRFIRTLNGAGKRSEWSDVEDGELNTLRRPQMDDVHLPSLSDDCFTASGCSQVVRGVVFSAGARSFFPFFSFFFPLLKWIFMVSWFTGWPVFLSSMSLCSFFIFSWRKSDSEVPSLSRQVQNCLPRRFLFLFPYLFD